MLEVGAPAALGGHNDVGAAENDRAVCSKVQLTADFILDREAKLKPYRQIGYSASAVEVVRMIFTKVV